MKEHVQKSEYTFRTIQSERKASKQAPISEISQAYKDGTIRQHSIQNESIQDEDLLQTKVVQQDHNKSILQRYKERNIQRYLPEEDKEPIQGKFWLKKDANYEWHEEDANENIYIRTDEKKRGWIFSYPVYIEKVLDLACNPTLKSEIASEKAKKTGNVTNAIYTYATMDFITMSSVYEKLNEQQKIEFNTYVDSIKDYCDTEGINSIIEGALKNVKAGALSMTEDEAKNIFINRLKLMTEYVINVGNKDIDGSSKIKDCYTIKSTGSDPHAKGEHALFLINRINQSKKLYKPHSLHLENAFTGNGEQSIISTFNKNLENGDKLPTMEFNPEQHTEEFIVRAGSHQQPLTDANSVQKHFYKLGMLEALSATFGLTDLHGENVIFNNNGPVIADGECGGWYGSTGIQDPNLGVTNIDENSNFTNSSGLHLEEAQGSKRQVKQNEYSHFFQQGKEKGEKILIENRASIIKAYQDQIDNIDSFRIVPIKTSDLAVDLDIYSKNHLELTTLARTRYPEVVQHMQSSNWAFNNMDGDNAQVHIYKNSFITNYSKALRAGTLPAFTLQLSSKDDILAGSILLDGEVIGDVGIDDEKLLKQKFAGRANNKIDQYEEERAEKISLLHKEYMYERRNDPEPEY